jgi:hypothetical protein
VLAQLADGELHLRTIAIEAREGMDADDVEATVGAGGFIKHALEGRPPIIGRRGSRLDKLLGDDPAPSLAKALSQVPLRWNGDIACCLTTGAHPQVKRGSPRRELITLRRGAECHGSTSIELKRICAGRRVTLAAGRPAARPLFAPGAREKVAEGTTEQAHDRIELLISDCHIAGKIAFDRKWCSLAILARSTRQPLGKLERARSRA